MRWLWRFLTDPRVGERLLRDHDEDKVDEVGRHLVCYIIPALLVVAGFVCWGAAAFSRQDWGWLPIILGLVLVVWGAVRALKRNIDRFVVTNQRVFRVHGLLNRKEATMPLTRILDISVDKPLHGRLLNFGHFTFESAAQDQGLREIRYVYRIDDRNKRIQETITDVGLRGRKVGA